MVDAEKARQTAARAALEVGVVGLGAALAGPVGALGGAALAAGVKPAIELLAVRESRGLRNIQHLMDAITEVTGLSPDEVPAWAQSREGRLALTTHTFQSAYDTLNENKIRAFATLLKNNIDDDAKLEMADVFVTALANIETPHIRVLDAMVGHYRCPRKTEDQYPPGVWGLWGLKFRFPGLASGLLPVMAALEGEAIVNGKGLPGNDPDTGKPDPVWTVTEFGRMCHWYLTGRSTFGP
jgi:hypothetical protein